MSSSRNNCKHGPCVSKVTARPNGCCSTTAISSFIFSMARLANFTTWLDYGVTRERSTFHRTSNETQVHLGRQDQGQALAGAAGRIPAASFAFCEMRDRLDPGWG